MGIFFSVFSGGQHLGEGTPGSIRRRATRAVVKIRERWRLESFESRLSVSRRHETDMVDNHYKTSKSVK